MSADSSARHKGGYKLAVVAIGVAALIVVTAVVILPPRPESSTTTPSVSNAGAVDSLLADHMQWLSARNFSDLVGQYTSNATVTWTGQAAGLTGNYSGASNIAILFGSVFGKLVSASATNVTEGNVDISGDLATVNSSFDFVGQSSAVGNLNATISARDYLVYSASSGAWLISQEVWNFLSFNDEQYPFSSGGHGSAPPSSQTIDALSLSADGNYLAAGTMTKSGPYNGSVYVVSLGSQAPSWSQATNNSAIDSVAVSANGSYVAAGSYAYASPSAYGGGEIYLFNSQGTMLWNVSTGSSPVWQVAMSANGSRIAADYERGVLYLNTAGQVLWNFTFPGRSSGSSVQFSMSSDGSSIAVVAEDMLIGNSTNFGWGVFYLNSQGDQVWNYTEDNGGANYVQMSSDGSYLVAANLYPYAAHNGSAYYFNGTTGVLLWRHQFSNAVLPVISPDGTYVATDGNGVQLFNSAGDMLWNLTNLGPAVAFLQSKSLIVFDGGPSQGVSLVGYNGTVMATFEFQSPPVASANGQLLAVASGSIGSGSCATVNLFEGLTTLPSKQLCP